jgi:glycosyltransferase involved in cell wall biosynthesis
MATYQGAAFVGEQLESIANQTRLPDELIVSDDRSVDTTVEIIERFATRSPFSVRLLRNDENLGFSRNFERALAETDGDLVFLSDQDDIWFPEKIERVVAEFERNASIQTVIHDQRILDQNSGTVFERSYFDNQRILGLAEKELVSGNFTALRREFVAIIQPFPARIAYDFWIARLSTALDCRKVLREPLQLYRRHSSNLSEPVLARQRPTLFSELLRMAPQDPRPYWRQKIEECELVASRIRERSDWVDEQLGNGRTNASLARLSREIRSLEGRLELMSLPPFRRRFEVLRSWRSGFYDQFSGAKSAIRDLLQPSPRSIKPGTD